jgi:HK97 family phage prohead protease
MSKLHSKILEHKQKAATVNYRSLSISETGQLVDASKFLEERVLAGYSAIYGRKNKHGEIVLRGAYAKSIQERGAGTGANYEIKMMGLNHDWDSPLSYFRLLEERETGLYFETKPLPEDDEDAVRVLAKVRSGLINNYSNGFDFVWDKMEYDEKQNAIIIKEADLYEISPVSIPSDMGTFTMRSAEDKAELLDEVEYFIKQIPQRFRMQARQLFARHKALESLEPLEDRKALQTVEPLEAAREVKPISTFSLIKNFKLQ